MLASQCQSLSKGKGPDHDFETRVYGACCRTVIHCGCGRSGGGASPIVLSPEDQLLQQWLSPGVLSSGVLQNE
jgi:hypothetical protein